MSALFRSRLLTLLLSIALIAAACGSSADVASTDDGAGEVAEVVEGEAQAESVEETTTTSDAPAEETTTTTSTTSTTSTTTEAPAEQTTTTTTEAPAEETTTTTTEAPAEQTTTTTTEAPAEETTTTTTEAPESTTEAPAAALDGQVLYESNCARCHQADGSGSRGPNIQGVTDPAVVTNIVTNGGFGMPAFPQLSAEEVEAIAAHVVTGL